MEEFDLPFAPQPASAARDGPPQLDPDQVARQAAAMAREIDRKLAREQPDPQLPPIRRQAPEPTYAGSVRLPHYSALHDPARLTGARSRPMRQFPQRFTECVSCGYRKLDTRLGDAKALGVDDQTAANNRQHFGPGERSYNLCVTDYDINGKVETGLYNLWKEGRAREDSQRTFRHDPRFQDMADRLSDIDSWRWEYRSGLDLGADLPDVREIEALAFLAPARKEDENEIEFGDDDEPYDGFELEERVPALSDYTGAIPAPDGYRLGTADPEFAHGAPYDAVTVGAAEAEGWMRDTEWDAARKQFFRAAWERAGEIEDPGMRHEARAFLAQRWDPRTELLEGEGARAAVTNPFAEPTRTVKTPYARSATPSGVDEGLEGEAPWRQGALARHEASVAKFLEEVKPKLAKRGLSDAAIAEMTSLPELRPKRLPRRMGREITKLWGPPKDRLVPGPKFHLDRERLPEAVGQGERLPTFSERIAAMRRTIRPTFLPPAAELDQVATEAAQRRSVMDDVDRIQVIEAAAGALDPERFREMAERARERDAFQKDVQAIDAVRGNVRKWSDAIHRADVDVRGATTSFAKEIRDAFKDPNAFQQAFKQLTDDEKRRALGMLREQPETFAREFATGFGRDFGTAGELRGNGATGEETGVRIGKLKLFVRPPTNLERAGVLAAGAGERYLDAVASRDVTRKHAALSLDLPGEAPLKQVRDTCTERMEAATLQKAQVIKSRDSLHAPTPEVLGDAFGALHPRERQRMLQEVPGLTTLLPERRRELARTGPSL